MSKPLQLIVACSENRVIGRAQRLPFDIPEDKEWFHQKTANQVVVLGRICFETWPAVLADGRRPVVISSQPELIHRVAARKLAPDARLDGANPPGTAGAGSQPVVVPTVAAALAAAQSLPGEIMICGGQRIYEETLPRADRLLLTLVHTQVDGDTYFPEWRQLAWRETWRRDSADDSYRYTFMILDRVR